MIIERCTPVAHRRDLSAIAYGFMASPALFAALGIDLFTHLAAGPRTAAGGTDSPTNLGVSSASCRRVVRFVRRAQARRDIRQLAVNLAPRCR